METYKLRVKVIKIGCDVTNWKKAWKIMLVWFGIVMAALCMAREWSVVAFGVTYGLGFGGIAYRYRRKVKLFFERMNLDNYVGFFLLAVVVSASEEVYCYLLGNEIAHPVLWVDLILVCGMWSVWFGTWYFFVSKKYSFEEKEALMTAGFTGVLFEFVGTGEILGNPLGIFLALPLAVVIYAALFVLPMQLMQFTGENTSWTKYVVGVVFPYVLTIPVGVALYAVLDLCGVL